MTNRLYYADSYRTEFSSAVAERASDGTRVYLEETAFYPTSGGQPHDVGTLGGARVIDVIDEGERIAHVLDAPLAVNDDMRIPGRIDWTRRFDHMQQHTGQHLLSAVFEDLFGAKTVSVHFGPDYSTLDLDAETITRSQMVAAEARANEIVAEARPVTVSFEDAESAIGLRKASDRSGQLRIVSIAELDRSACGGTHVRSTSEIGAILLRSVERVRKTSRV
ncbi:MAG TPA: alanyl-tRNA editing protein, partial [Gemmatimonadaceae bacterium]